MRHAGVNLSYTSLLSNDGLDLSILESGNRTSEKSWVIPIEDPKVSVVPDDFVSVIEVVRSVVLNLAIHQRLMPVSIRARKWNGRHAAYFLRPHC